MAILCLKIVESTMRCGWRTLDSTDTVFVRTKSLSAAAAFLRRPLQRPRRLDLFCRIGGQQLGVRWRVVARLKTRFLDRRGRSALRFDEYRAAPGRRPCFASSLAGNLLSFRRTQISISKIYFAPQLLLL
ncbi:hypothetical protein GUJ93_ZPchr0011g28488 [Zizania palustris]|uniref:Uncharacterized protein n=1 Tax=Zizania palustris TaxID=103762 RepID=A0A8J5WKA9_ZIZPA|nr:hypothetical protein GUJ93_ZPchr0011g28488 [Zizania palustris]